MKHILLLFLVLAFLPSLAQEGIFHLQGQIVDSDKNPVANTNIFNERSQTNHISKSNGVFDLWVLPGDSIIITHISFVRKTVTVYQLMVNPVVQLERDTINIRPVNVSPNQRTDYDAAMKNIERINYDFRTQPTDNYSQSEQMRELLKTEDKVQRTAASSVKLVSFSPSQAVGKWAEKRKRKKEAKQFSSTKEKE